MIAQTTPMRLQISSVESRWIRTANPLRESGADSTQVIKNGCRSFSKVVSESGHSITSITSASFAPTHRILPPLSRMCARDLTSEIRCSIPGNREGEAIREGKLCFDS